MALRTKELKKKFKVSIPVTIAAPLQELYHDPILGRPSYGSLSDLISELLRDYLSRLGIRTIGDAIAARDTGLAKTTPPGEDL